MYTEGITSDGVVILKGGLPITITEVLNLLNRLDLDTYKQVKFTFDIQSDHSTMCNGYRSLCKTIEEIENEIDKNK